MHIEHKPGYATEVDWAGATMSVTDEMTGESLTAYLFVGALPYSGYVYAEAFLDMATESWISAHVHMLSYYGGAPIIFTPDNLKTGIIKPEYYDPILNRSYGEMVEYYGCTVLPARVKKPKDKPTVEGSVGKVTTWIIAALRNHKFFDIRDLNAAVREKLDEFNEREFNGKCSRLQNYLQEEKEFMRPLPTTPYEMAVWKKLTPGFNYHVSVDRNFYSVPCQYIKHEVDVRITGFVVEVFAAGLRICCHQRKYGKPGQYSTITDHMPEKHKKYGEWNANRFIKWGSSIGENTETVVRAILASHAVEQQGYRACMGVLKLAERNGAPKLEAACKKALTYTPSPTYKHVDSIIKSGLGNIEQASANVEEADNPHAFVRGADYYGRGK
jgi:transposase